MKPSRLQPSYGSASVARRLADLGGKRAAVLLEVVLALVLFVAAAAVITSAINASLESVERQKLNLHAANLAITVLSELQLGQRSAETAGPEPFRPPFEHWSWQLVPSSREARLLEAESLTVVEVIVRHDDPPVTYRIAQSLKAVRGAKTAALASPGGRAL